MKRRRPRTCGNTASLSISPPPSSRDPRLLAVADLEHSEVEERWFSVGRASNDSTISVVYLWSELDARSVKIRLISAREATHAEAITYEENK
jgi:uncharacterized DUF497 family protein